MLGIKQETLASQMGTEWNQQKVSLLEQKEVLEPEVLYMVAKVLKMPEAAICNFDEEQAVNIIANTFEAGSIGYQYNNNPVFNPLDTLIRLHDEKIALYERMLQEKESVILRLQELLKQ